MLVFIIITLAVLVTIFIIRKTLRLSEIEKNELEKHEDLAPESTPSPVVVEAIKATKKASKNIATVKPLAKMEAKKKTKNNA